MTSQSSRPSLVLVRRRTFVDTYSKESEHLSETITMPSPKDVSTEGTHNRPRIIARAQLAEAIIDGLVTVDESGRIVEWNPASERLFGHARDGVLGRRFISVSTSEAPRSPCDVQALSVHGRIDMEAIVGQRVELRAETRAGESLLIEVETTEFGVEGSLLLRLDPRRDRSKTASRSTRH